MRYKCQVKENSNLNLTWISNVIFRVVFFIFKELEVRGDLLVCIVDNGGIVDYHCLNFLFIITKHVGFQLSLA